MRERVHSIGNLTLEPLAHDGCAGEGRANRRARRYAEIG